MSTIVEKAMIRARDAFSRNVTQDVKFRVAQLKKLYAMIDENSEAIIEALNEDLKKPRTESVFAEVEFVKGDIQNQLDIIHEMTQPQFVKKGLVNMMDDAFIKYDPFGVVLIFGPWNYPMQLLLCPLAGAIAAGNCVVMKPSEVAAATEKLLTRLIPRYLDQNCYHVITGGPEVAGQILSQKFDLIFFTGSTMVGKIVYEAAAKHLTPVVLELGGKSPVFIDESVTQIEVAAKRILWAKYMNAGQTCIAPDYLMCSPRVQDKFINASRKILKEFYDSEPKNSASFGRIINGRNFDRLGRLLQGTKGIVAIGGETEKNSQYISPTIVSNVQPSDTLMSEELFGPILPIVTVHSSDEAIEYINRAEKPLALYLFSNKKDVVNRFLEQTSSGSVCVNDCFVQAAVHTLPFGGVGGSGMGKYHGKYSFETFSHSKSVLAKNYNPILEYLSSVRYPPYSDKNLKKLLMMITKSPIDDINFKKIFSYLVAFMLGIGLMYAISLRK